MTMRTRGVRPGAFALVAVLGFIVQAVMIVVLTQEGVPVPAATAAGVGAAILHNFAWHERWTWADRRRAGNAAGRLARVALSTGLVSLIGTVVLTTWLASLGTPVVIGNLLAVWATGLLNYTLLDRLIYRALQ